MVPTDPVRRHPRATALLTGAVLAACFTVLYLLAVRTSDGQQADVDLFGWATTAGDAPGVAGWATVVRAVAPAVLGVACVVAAARAVVRRRWRPLLAAALVVALSAAAARLLRTALLDRPYLGDFAYVENTFPSGHVAVTLAVGIALTILVPRRARGAVAAAVAVVVLLAGPASVVTLAHRPSDILGSVLLVGSLTGLVGALLLREGDLSGRRTEPGSGRRRRAT